MAILPIVIVPDPLLKQKSSPVEKVDDNVRQLMKDMLETMYEVDCVGLAAVQVGVLKRVIVMDFVENDKYLNKPYFMANPEITYASEETVEMNEGCGSVPGVRVKIIRPKKVKVKFLDYNGDMQEIEATGIVARCIQHEISHADGITLLDYVSPLKRDIFIRKIKKYKGERF